MITKSQLSTVTIIISVHVYTFSCVFLNMQLLNEKRFNHIKYNLPNRFLRLEKNIVDAAGQCILPKSIYM